MTDKRSVADDVLGKVATRQWELYRRVKEGALDVVRVLDGLQTLIPGDRDIKPRGQSGSVSGVDLEPFHVRGNEEEIMVLEGTDFVSVLDSLGFVFWDRFGRKHYSFALAGKETKNRIPQKFKVVELKHDMTVGDIKKEVSKLGYTVASSWELLSFITQCRIFPIYPSKEFQFLALGDAGKVRWQESGEETLAIVRVHGTDVGEGDEPEILAWEFEILRAWTYKESLVTSGFSCNLHLSKQK